MNQTVHASTGNASGQHSTHSSSFAQFALGYEKVCRAILLVFVVNIAIVIHTLMGLIVAGFFPSIAAAYATYRAWLLAEDRDWKVKEMWVIFHRFWKSDLISANIFGYALSAVWAVLSYSMFLVLHNDMGPLGYASSGILLLAALVLGLFTVLSWAIRANFAENNRWSATMSLQFVLARPLCSLVLVLLFVLTVLAWATWPGLLAAFGVSIPILLAEGVVFAFGKLPGMQRQHTPADE